MKPLNLNYNSAKKLQNLNDKELVELIVETKNILVFEILLIRYEGTIYNKILGFVKTEQEAVELTQTFFVVLFSEINLFKGPYEFSAWLYERAYKICINHLEKRKVVGMQSISEKRQNDHLQIEVSDAILYRMNVRKLKKAMTLITPEDKAVLMLRYQDDISLKNLALLLKLDNDSIKSVVRKAKARIVEVYNEL